MAIAGPCFRCNTQNVTLTGILLNPIAGANCTFQWYDENGLIPGATGTTLQVTSAQKGPFIFEVKCVLGNITCLKRDTFDLKQCGANPNIVVSNLIFDNIKDVKLYPNPTPGILISPLMRYHPLRRRS